MKLGPTQKPPRRDHARPTMRIVLGLCLYIFHYYNGSRNARMGGCRCARRRRVAPRCWWGRWPSPTADSQRRLHPSVPPTFQTSCKRCVDCVGDCLLCALFLSSEPIFATKASRPLKAARVGRCLLCGACMPSSRERTSQCTNQDTVSRVCEKMHYRRVGRRHVCFTVHGLAAPGQTVPSTAPATAHGSFFSALSPQLSA